MPQAAGFGTSLALDPWSFPQAVSFLLHFPYPSIAEAVTAPRPRTVGGTPHRGHASRLAEVRRLATAVGGPGIALTFDPHPLQLLRPESFLPVLTTPEEKARLLLEFGADQVILLRTTPDLLQLTAEEFFRWV